MSAIRQIMTHQLVTWHTPEVLKNSICNLNEKFTLLKYFEHLPGTDVAAQRGCGVWVGVWVGCVGGGGGGGGGWGGGGGGGGGWGGGGGGGGWNLWGGGGICGGGVEFEKKKWGTQIINILFESETKCYCKQMLLSSRSNIYVVSVINNSDSGFLLQMPLQIWYSL